MKWFGEPWGAPCCESEPVEVPVDQCCIKCGEPFLPGDRGLVLPMIADDVAEAPWHLACFLAGLGVHISIVG